MAYPRVRGDHDTGISHVTVNKFLRGEGETLDQTVIKLCLYLSLDWYSKRAEPTK